jgi:xanthine dehydrogenase accessory factor
MLDNQSQSSQSIIKAVEQLLEANATGVLITIIDRSPHVGAKLLVDETGTAVGSLVSASLENAVRKQVISFLQSREETRTLAARDFAADAELVGEALLLFERIRPEPRLVICGAGHVGAALAKLASLLGYRITLIDDRGEFVRRDRFPDENIQLVTADDWTSAVTAAVGGGRGVAVAIVTRGHNEDEECLRAVVASNPDYVGMIGSKRRTSIVLERLRKTADSDAKMREVRAPIGLDIGAVSPEEVALSILAEIVAERRGGQGGSLSAWRRARST